MFASLSMSISISTADLRTILEFRAFGRPGPLSEVSPRGRHQYAPFPKTPRTHLLRLLGPKTILHMAFGLF